jgi:hypothetical protein
MQPRGSLDTNLREKYILPPRIKPQFSRRPVRNLVTKLSQLDQLWARGLQMSVRVGSFYLSSLDLTYVLLHEVRGFQAANIWVVIFDVTTLCFVSSREKQ